MSKVLMVTSEASPFAKTGGLADVLGALPNALHKLGDQVAVLLPLYRGVLAKLAGPQRVYEQMAITFGARSFNVDVLRQQQDGIDFYFADCPPLFDRASLYGEGGADYPDNHIRFGVLSRTALGIMRHLFRPDIVHLHDWQAALVAPMMRAWVPFDPTFTDIKIALSIHNLGYQGLFPRSALADLDLPESLFRADRMEFYGQVNLLKGGLVFADALTTVSRGYAAEIQTKEYGFGLDGLLRLRSKVLTGILNGVDYEEWNPETDPFLPAHYQAADLSGKRTCKADLLREFGLKSSAAHRPLIGIVSRFVGQKGFDLIEEMGPELMAENVTLIALGTGEPRFEKALLTLAQEYPEKVSVRIGYDNALAHKVEAGSDIFLMPSQYEPCGLNQIYSLRYGTVPVVRATGGLDDTIDERTGFKFQEYSGAAMLDAIRSALAAFTRKERWQAMMLEGMAKDFSWDASAAEYSALYKRISR